MDKTTERKKAKFSEFIDGLFKLTFEERNKVLLECKEYLIQHNYLTKNYKLYKVTKFRNYNDFITLTKLLIEAKVFDEKLYVDGDKTDE